MASDRDKFNLLKEDRPSSKIAGTGRSVGVVNEKVLKPKPVINCYIINQLTGTRVSFVTLPESISESYSAGFNPQDILGRSAPYMTFNSNEARSVSYSVKLHEDLCKDMMDVITELKKMVYPRYSGSIVEPPFCYVKFGDIVDMTAVLNSVSLDWQESIIEDNQHFSTVEVSLDFTEIRVESIPTVDNPFE